MAGAVGWRSGMWAMGILAVLAGPLAAAPLRVSLHGLDDPGPASQAPDSAEPARFVAVDAEATPPAPRPGPRAVPLRALEDDEGELDFEPSHELPRHVAGPEQELPRPDDARGLVRLLDGAGAVAVPAPPVLERRLGDFAPTAPAGSGDEASAAPTVASVDLPAAEAEPTPDLPLVDREAIHRQRLITVLVLLPLLLAAIVLLWRMDRGRRHRHHQRTSHRGPRVRHG